LVHFFSILYLFLYIYFLYSNKKGEYLFRKKEEEEDEDLVLPRAVPYTKACDVINIYDTKF